MRDNIITMSFYKETRVPVLTDAYRFQPKGKLAFVQRWLWKLLHRMGALKFHFDEIVDYKRIYINRDDFSKSLYEAYGRCFPYRKPTKVYMGPEEFDKLAKTSIAGHCSMFSFDIPMGYQTMFNLPVTVVPHMNGVLII